MKRALRRLLGFLERKFPDKVIVTEASYLALNQRLGALESNLAAAGERLKKLELNVDMHNQAMGFAQRPGAILER